MKASELVLKLQGLIMDYGDHDVAIDDGLKLKEVAEVDLGSEEDNCIVIWMKKSGGER